MLSIDIPDFGLLELEHLVTDYTGTLSEDGKVGEGVKERLNELSKNLQVHVVTSDTFGTAEKELESVHCTVYILENGQHDLKKEYYVKSLGAEKVVAIGNGRNDRNMLGTAKLGITVCMKEGCSVEALQAGDVLVTTALDALGLLLHPKRLIATLRS